MKSLFRWFLMLNKRLYKKAAFIAILLIIPIAVITFAAVAKQESGFVTIVLASHDNSDKISAEITEELLNGESLIHFIGCNSPEDALKEVEYGRADAAWIFSSGMQEKVDDFAKVVSDYRPIVSVVEREEKISLRLAREKLSAAVYKYCARAYYLDFARFNVKKLNNLSDSEILEYYDNLNITEQLFEFDSGVKKDSKPEFGNYLVAPVRGLLSVVMLLCSLAAALFFMQDEKNGTFSLVPLKKRLPIAFGCILIAVLNVGVVVFAALCFSGLSGSALSELSSLLCYSIACTSFSLLLTKTFKSIKLYGALIPLFVIITIAICPVFFDFRRLSVLQHLFPPTYYINSFYDNLYFPYMLLFSVACIALTKVISINNKY